MTAATEKCVEIMPGVVARPQIAMTSCGPVEYDLTEGDASLPVVLGVHGGLGGFDQARAMLSWLDPEEFRLLSPSRPGYLGTPLETGRMMEEQADALVSLLDALEIEKAVLLAASAGGPPAYLAAIRRPDRVRALVVADCVSGYYTMPQSAGPITQAIFLSNFGQKLIQMLGRVKPSMVLQSVFQAESLFTKQQMKRHIDYVLDNRRAMDFVTAFMKTMSPYGRRKVGTENDMAIYETYTHLPLEKIKCPTLVIHGTHDSDVLFSDGVYAWEHIPNAEKLWIEEGSHLGFWISPGGIEKAQPMAAEFIRRYEGA